MTLALTPPMGWNSWNTFGEAIDEALIRETADVFVSEGLKDAGYRYVNLDDLWEAKERDGGRLTWDRAKFPGGLPALAEYVHGKGLQFGIYSCAGSHTCAGMPGSYGCEAEDAAAFAAWGVDFLKYDFCYVPPGVDGPMLYQRMGQALRAPRRPIVFSACEWGKYKPWEWGARVGAHLWRTTGDIDDSWESILQIGFRKQVDLHAYAGPGHWNDPDMLVVGMYGKGNVAKGGCSDVEYRSHMSLWCLLAAPLLIGCDVRRMSAATKRILTNPEVIAVDQDPLGRQACRVGGTSYAGEIAEVWAKPMSDGSVAVGLFNLGEREGRLVSVAWESLGIPDRLAGRVRDLWAREDLGEFRASFTARVDRHGVCLVRIQPPSP